MSHDRAALVYVDTSALIKWYLNEPGSEAFVRWIADHSQPWVSRLTAVELRCLLARRRRIAEISEDIEARAYATFEEDVDRAHLYLHPLQDETMAGAIRLIDRLDEHGLRTLDALHLSLARELEAGAVATADRKMADAARALGLEVVGFWSS